MNLFFERSVDTEDKRKKKEREKSKPSDICNVWLPDSQS